MALPRIRPVRETARQALEERFLDAMPDDHEGLVAVVQDLLRQMPEDMLRKATERLEKDMSDAPEA